MNDKCTKPTIQEIRLISAQELARMLSLSKRQIHRLNSCHKLPAPLRIGGAVRWSAQEINEWLAAGAPDRKTWEVIKQGRRQQ